MLSATSPLLRAVELNERGAFTEILLAGLAGAGKAKIYDKDTDEYIVRVDRLFAYVEEEVRKKQILVTAPPDPPLYQRVYPETRNVPTPPTLSRIPLDAVAPVSLEIFIEPDGIWTQTDVKIRVTSEDADYDKEIVPVRGVPVDLPPVLLPKSYIVRAEANGFQPEQRRWPIDLYEPQTRKLKLNPMQMTSGGSATGGPGDGGTDGGEINAPLGTRGGGIFKSIDGVALTTGLTARSSDPLAPIEIYDNKGELMAEGQGVVIVGNIKPGFYRARLVTPEGKMAEELIDLSPGENEEVFLDAPSLPNYGLFKEIVDRTDLHMSEDDQTLRFSEDVGPMATPQLTTMLALAGSVVVRQYGWGPKATQLGLPSFRELTSPGAQHGLRIICADEVTHLEGAANYLAQLSLRFWKQDADAETVARAERARLLLSQDFTGIGDFAREIDPGAYVLELNVPERSPVYFSLAILPFRLTLVVLHRRADGGIRIFSYSPSIHPPPPEETPLVVATKLRRLELLQRFYLADRVDGRHAFRNAIELLHAKWIDPLAGCLGGYTMLKLGQAEELDVAVENMNRLYSELPDTHILTAEYHRSRETDDGAAAARRSYMAALDRGLPVFAEGLLRLASSIEPFSISHPRAEEVMRVFRNRARNLLWTAWTAQEETGEDVPGE